MQVTRPTVDHHSTATLERHRPPAITKAHPAITAGSPTGAAESTATATNDYRTAYLNRSTVVIQVERLIQRTFCIAKPDTRDVYLYNGNWPGAGGGTATVGNSIHSTRRHADVTITNRTPAAGDPRESLSVTRRFVDWH